jgi:hypothetical protein
VNVQPLMTEKQLQDTVERIAHWRRWLTYHTHDSRRSAPGFPDLTLVRPPRLLFVELKSEHGHLSREQVKWLAALEGVPGVEVHTWKPEDLQSGRVEAVLR